MISVPVCHPTLVLTFSPSNTTFRIQNYLPNLNLVCVVIRRINTEKEAHSWDRSKMAIGRDTASASSGNSKRATTCQSACRQSQNGKGERGRSHSFLWQFGPTVPAGKTEWPQNELKHRSAKQNRVPRNNPTPTHSTALCCRNQVSWMGREQSL